MGHQNKSKGKLCTSYSSFVIHKCFLSYLHIIPKISHKLIAAIRTIKLSYYCWYLFCVHASVSSNCVSQTLKENFYVGIVEWQINHTMQKQNELVGPTVEGQRHA